jgi:hypothetical protein
MSQAKRIYIVTGPAGRQLLVEAVSQSAAINSVVSNLYSARIAKPKEIVELMQVGLALSDDTPVNVIAAA